MHNLFLQLKIKLVNKNSNIHKIDKYTHNYENIINWQMTNFGNYLKSSEHEEILPNSLRQCQPSSFPVQSHLQLSFDMGYSPL